MTKKFFALVFVFLSISCAFSEVNLTSTVNKGESIIITGYNITSTEPVAAVISYEDFILSNDTVLFVNNSFNYSRTVSYLEPSGVWNLQLLWRNYSITVNPTPNSSAFLVNFISPVVSSIHSRADVLSIKVNITRNLVPVENASVKAYLNGEVLSLEYEEGIYLLDYELPYNALIGSKRLIITCFKDNLGGENILGFDVRTAVLNLNVINPSTSSISMGDTLPVYFKVAYANGEELVNPVLTVSANNNPLNLSSANNIEYYSQYLTSSLDGDNIIFSIKVSDAAGNTASYSAPIAVTDELLYYIKQNALYISTAVILLLAIIIFSYLKTSTAISKDQLNKKKKELLELSKKAQDDYFNKGIIDKNSYEKLSNDYEEEILRIDEKMKKIKK